MPINDYAYRKNRASGILVGSSGGSSFTGLLDDYPNAAAAYSVRRLSSTYTGSLIRVRRSSDNAESDIGYNASNELDQSALTAFVGANNGFITNWYDQSGNSNNQVNATASQQPQIVSSGSVLLENGKPRVQFDGSNDILISTYGTAQPITTSGVFKMDDFSFNTFYSGGPNLADRVQFYYTAGTVKMFSGAVLSGTTSDTNQHLFFNIHDSGSSELNIDASNEASGAAGIQVLSNFQLGGQQSNATAFPLTGSIQEVVLWPLNNNANQSGIETNTNNYFSVY